MPAAAFARRYASLCRALGAGAGVLVLAACGGGGSGGGGPVAAPVASEPVASEPAASAPALGEIPAMSDTSRLSFPLDAYDPSPADQRLLERAQDRLAVRCMARYGFEYVPPKRSGGPERPVNSRVFGVVDAEEAARYGYRDPGAASADRPRDPELSAEGRLTLYGERVAPAEMPMSQEEAEREGGSERKVGGKSVPVGGCNRESYLKLYAPKADAVDIMFVFNLKARAKAQGDADARLRRNNEEWAACMKKAGYRATDPMAVVRQLGFEGALDSPAAVAAAKADVACKKKVNLVGVRYTVLAAYQQRLVDQHAATLELAVQQQEDRLEQAADLVG
ncbi:hypothetical protein [Streptomyces sp. TRM68416]|uniref:hypothetical protein n=1 Tax=Streptomyces sp. TRM68416 TaxID=2758412 RepID=UPI001661A003|nr:hypothetical protein [Streptomyces sp. TRM68416]MBD0844734.1 hypothetical protein [Streptomyces sp. TRM68416]